VKKKPTTSVYFHSTTGNTRKVALAMAEALGVEARQVTAKGSAVEAGLLFLGGAVYGSYDHDLHPSLKAFIASLDPSKVGRVALFKTGFETDALLRMGALLKRRGIEVETRTFACPGRFLLFMLGHPNRADLEEAADFAKSVAGR